MVTFAHKIVSQHVLQDTRLLAVPLVLNYRGVARISARGFPKRVSNKGVASRGVRRARMLAVRK